MPNPISRHATAIAAAIRSLPHSGLQPRRRAELPRQAHSLFRSVPGRRQHRCGGARDAAGAGENPRPARHGREPGRCRRHARRRPGREGRARRLHQCPRPSYGRRGGAFATASTPEVPPAPARFSTTTDWPENFLQRRLASRAPPRRYYRQQGTERKSERAGKGGLRGSPAPQNPIAPAIATAAAMAIENVATRVRHAGFLSTDAMPDHQEFNGDKVALPERRFCWIGRGGPMVPFFVQIKCQLGKSYEVANRLATPRSPPKSIRPRANSICW